MHYNLIIILFIYLFIFLCVGKSNITQKLTQLTYKILLYPGVLSYEDRLKGSAIPSWHRSKPNRKWTKELHNADCYLTGTVQFAH